MRSQLARFPHSVTLKSGAEVGTITRNCLEYGLRVY